MTHTLPMTTYGYEKLQRELKDLMTNKRLDVAAEIARARSYGDLSENAEYQAAKEKQYQLEKRIRELEDKLSRAHIVDVSTLSGTKICFGATVVLVDEDEDKEVCYQIVGSDEADVQQQKLSIESRLARALIGKELGARFEFSTPGGEKSYFIRSVEYKV